jgi:hypothetical protein
VGPGEADPVEGTGEAGAVGGRGGVAGTDVRGSGELSARLEVSRIPIREALPQLEAEV